MRPYTDPMIIAARELRSLKSRDCRAAAKKIARSWIALVASHTNLVRNLGKRATLAGVDGLIVRAMVAWVDAESVVQSLSVMPVLRSNLDENPAPEDRMLVELNMIWDRQVISPPAEDRADIAGVLWQMAKSVAEQDFLGGDDHTQTMDDLRALGVKHMPSTKEELLRRYQEAYANGDRPKIPTAYTNLKPGGMRGVKEKAGVQP